jgi:hypothetical protein
MWLITSRPRCAGAATRTASSSAFSFTRGAHEEVARVRSEGELNVRLVKVVEFSCR